MAEKTAPRQVILEAVVTCIERYGLENVTTRKIAIEAGSNIAAINYYFRSKDDLIAETLSMTIKHMLEDVFIAMDKSAEPFEVTITNVLFYLLDGSLRFPGISRAHLHQAIADGRSVSARALTRLFDRLVERAAQAYPRTDPRLVRLRISQIMASIMFTMLTPGFFRVSRDYKLADSKHARRLAESYAQLFRSGV
jgi:AcrR family transcriptional regulator